MSDEISEERLQWSSYGTASGPAHTFGDKSTESSATVARYTELLDVSKYFLGSSTRPGYYETFYPNDKLTPDVPLDVRRLRFTRIAAVTDTRYS